LRASAATARWAAFARGARTCRSPCCRAAPSGPSSSARWNAARAASFPRRPTATEPPAPWNGSSRARSTYRPRRWARGRITRATPAIRMWTSSRRQRRSPAPRSSACPPDSARYCGSSCTAAATGSSRRSSACPTTRSRSTSARCSGPSGPRIARRPCSLRAAPAALPEDPGSVSDRLRIASLNTLNLRLPGRPIYQDPGYTQEEFDAKASWLAGMIDTLASQLVGLQEIFDEQALTETISRCSGPPPRWFAAPEPRDTPDLPRVALLSWLDALSEVESVHRIPEGFSVRLPAAPEIGLPETLHDHFSRPVLGVTVNLATGLRRRPVPARVYVVHLKSRR